MGKCDEDGWPGTCSRLYYISEGARARNASEMAVGRGERADE